MWLFRLHFHHLFGRFQHKMDKRNFIETLLGYQNIENQKKITRFDSIYKNQVKCESMKLIKNFHTHKTNFVNIYLGTIRWAKYCFFSESS